MSRKSDSESDTDSVYDMPSGKWVVTDKVRSTSEGEQKSLTKSKKSVHPTVNFDKGVPHNTQENQFYSGRRPSEYYDDREYTFPKERSRLSPEEHDIERGNVFKQEWSRYTPFRHNTDVLDEPCYYRGQQRVRSPPRLGYVRGGPHYSGGQYEVKSPYDQGYVRSPREYYKPSYSDKEEDIDHNNNVSVVSKLRGGSPKGDVLGPASPSQVPVQWKLTPIDVDVAKPLYSFLPRPCRYTEYYLRGDPRFHQK